MSNLDSLNLAYLLNSKNFVALNKNVMALDIPISDWIVLFGWNNILFVWKKETHSIQNCQNMVKIQIRKKPYRM